MGDAGYFRGTSAEQDNRFSDKEKKLMKQMKFADSTSKKVDMSKIKLEVLKPWISNRIVELLGMEDDVLEEFVSNQLEAENFPDGRRIQINLTGFLNGKNARIFTGELWDLLLSAQEQDSGIPASIIEAKKEEIKQRHEEKQKVKETVERTLGHFLPSVKKERSSPPSGKERDSGGANNHNSSDPYSKNTSRSRDSDRDRRSDRDKERHGRQYRQRPSRSHSRSPQLQSKDRNRDVSDRNRRDRRDDHDDRRSTPTPQQLIDAARERDRLEHERNRERDRQERERNRDRMYSRYRESGDGRDSRSRREGPPRRVQSPEPVRSSRRQDTTAEERGKWREVADPTIVTKDSESESKSSSSSESEEERIETKKQKRKPSRGDSSDSSPKSKKKKKKSKKQKKLKKLKVKKKETKAVEDSSSSTDDTESEVEENAKNREELEKSLRERALASMKRRQERGQESSSN